MAATQARSATRAKPRTVLTPAQAKRLAAKYKKGASLREVASEFGVSYGTAHTTVKTAGVLRSKGGAA